MLHDSWVAGDITDEELAVFLPWAWLYAQAPEDMLPASGWVAMLRACGPLREPVTLPDLPSHPFDVFRGATHERRSRLSWYLARRDAEVILPRHRLYGDARIYSTRATRDEVLAYFRRADEGPEVLLDPDSLGGVAPA
jgi:hypothetical protein